LPEFDTADFVSLAVVLPNRLLRQRGAQFIGPSNLN
jgi:hypothetical protein